MTVKPASWRRASTGRGQPGRKWTRPSSRPTLTDQGVDKHLADRARKAAAMANAKFEADVERTGRIAAGDDRQ